MILPLAKLGTLAIRTLSKPLASRLKVQAARHERFRNFIESFAQANHKFTVNLQRRIYGHATNVEIRPLDPEKAVQAAADLLGELVIFSVGVAAVLFEVQRSARSEARKEEARKQEIERMAMGRPFPGVTGKGEGEVTVHTQSHSLFSIEIRSHCSWEEREAASILESASSSVLFCFHSSISMELHPHS